MVVPAPQLPPAPDFSRYTNRPAPVEPFNRSVTAMAALEAVFLLAGVDNPHFWACAAYGMAVTGHRQGLADLIEANGLPHLVRDAVCRVLYGAAQ